MNKERLLRSFLVIWVGQAFSLLGSQVVQFALIWWLTKTTGSATVLAVASLVGLLPRVVLGPFAGVLVDRWPRRTVMISADSVVALATLLLGYLFWADLAQPWHVFAILFVRGLGGTFHWPAMEASATLMVPEKQLTRIQGMNQTLNGLLQIGAAPLGALLLELLPLQGIVAIDVVTAAIAIAPLLFIAIPQPAAPRSADGAVASYWQGFHEGLRYVRGWPALMQLILIATILNLFLSPATSLLPIVIVQHFQGGAMQLAWVESGLGVGIVLGGVLLSAWGGFQRRMLTVVLGIIAGGLAVLLFALTPGSLIWLAVAAFFLLGVTLPLVNGPIGAIMQAAVAPEIQGRVFTLLGSLVSLMSPVGLIVAGPLADLVDVRIWFFVAAAANLLVGGAALFSHELMHMDDRQAGDQLQGEPTLAPPTLGAAD